MARYSGKRKRSRNRKYTPTRQTVHLPRIPRAGGSYGRSKNYFRHHDFKYEPEPRPKAPKEVEAHYLREETPSYEQTAPAHSFPSGSKFIPNMSEGKAQTKLETSPEETKTDVEITEPLPVEPVIETSQMEREFNITVEAEPSAFSEIPPDITLGPELYEAYELPAKDLELLLFELEANPLTSEVQPERKLETESLSEA